MRINLEKLYAPFPPEKVEWRVGSRSKDKTKGLALAYIDARSVMDRLDEVCGAENWQCRYTHAYPSSVSYFDTDKVSSKTMGKTVCEIGIRLNGEWIWKADGAGDTDFEAEKGALSDAFKRAAVKWGIGRYLYDIPATWVNLDQFGNILPVELERLMALLPNAESGVKVIGAVGISKHTAKFWERDNLELKLPASLMPKEGETWGEKQKEWWLKKFREGIDKAPNRELLAKYQLDNQHIIDSFDTQTSFSLYEACAVRAEQLTY